MRIHNILKVKFILTFLSIVICSNLSAKDNTTSFKLFFKQGSDIIIDSYTLRELNALVDSSILNITHIDIVGYCSPEGSVTLNMSLAMARGESVAKYLTEISRVPDSLITIKSGGVAWREFQQILKEQKPGYATRVMSILESTPDYLRNDMIKNIEGGSIYSTLLNNIYPSLRYADVVIYLKQTEKTVEEVTPAPETEEPYIIVITPPEHVAAEPEYIQRALFALKTNLLFDLATLINIEIEVPIRERWSIAAEYIFPWWVMDNHEADSRRNRIQLLNGNLEARYWWGDREEKAQLTGWFTGVYTGIGLYDFEYNAKGYQGEFFIAAGVSGGYAHTINKAKSLRMEYSIGIGYLATDYRYYNAEYCYNDLWHAIEQRSGRYWWFGPTRAKVSLSWLINYKDKK